MRLLALAGKRDLALLACGIRREAATLRKGALELGVADLRRNLRVAALVYLEHLSAIGALDLGHGILLIRLIESSLPHTPDEKGKGPRRAPWRRVMVRLGDALR